MNGRLTGTKNREMTHEESAPENMRIFQKCLIHICNEAYTEAVVAADVVVRGDTAAIEVHVVRVALIARSR